MILLSALLSPVFNWAQYWVPFPNDSIVGVDGYRSIEIFNDTLILCGDVGFYNDQDNWGSIAWYDGEFIPIGLPEPFVTSVLGSTIHENELVVVSNFLFEYSDDLWYEDLAVWDGQDWDGLENFYNGPSGNLQDAISFNGDLLVCGPISFIPAADFPSNVAKWNGEEWIDPGGVSGSYCRNLVIYNDTLIGGGAFITGNDDGEPGSGIFYWDNDTTWHEYAGGVQGNVFCSVVDTINDDLYVGGFFFEVGDGVEASGVARWDGFEWSAIEEGTLIPDNVQSLGIYRNQLYASGLFEHVLRNGEEVPMRHVMYFDGAQWQPMDGGMSGSAFDMVVYEDHLVLAGSTSWVSEDSIPINDVVRWYVHPDSVVWGVEEQLTRDIQHFNLYPNPNDGFMTLEFEERNSGNLLVTDLNGRQVYFEAIDNRKRIELQLLGLTSGTYLVSVVEGGVIWQTERVVIE